MSNFQNKKILVTGGTGHLGSSIVHHLVDRERVAPENITVLYLPGSPVNSLDDITGLQFFPANILNRSEVLDGCKNQQLVFHTIGSTTFDPRQKKMQWLVNVEGTRNILDACLQTPSFEKICYTSTVNVLGVPNPIGGIGSIENSSPYTNIPSLHSFKSREETLEFIRVAHEYPEGNWPQKIGIGYFDSKLAAQELVNEYFQLYNLNVVSLLPGTMFGPYDFLIGTGLYILSVYRNQMPVVLRSAGLPLAHVMDVAGGHVLAMEKAERGTQYILSGKPEDNKSLIEMIGGIAEVLQSKFPDRKFQVPFFEVPYLIAYGAAFISESVDRLFNNPMLLSRDAIRAGANQLYYTSDKATIELGYEPQFNFHQAVSDMVDYYIANDMMERKGRWIDRR